MIKRNIQALMIVVLLFAANRSGFAQEDMKEQQQNMNREMTLEREYDPIVQDAAKVNILPEVPEIVITKRPIVYSDYTAPVSTKKIINVLPSSVLMTDVEHGMRNGYLHLGGGMSMNLVGDIGYKLINTDADVLSAYFSHRSANGNVTPLDGDYEKRKAKFNDNLAALDLKHFFDNITLNLGGNFGYSTFNYYGIYSPPDIASSPYADPDTATNQSNRIINVYAGVATNSTASTGYHIGVDYTGFKQKYSLSKELDGMNENNFGINLGLNSPENDGKRFGADLKMNFLSYTAAMQSRLPRLDSAAFDARFDATLNPYFLLEDEKLRLLVGVNLSLTTQGGETDVFASPNMSLDVPFANTGLFYIKLGGGLASNTMAELSRTNRYINPAFTPDPSKTWADAKLGVSSSPSAGLWFDLFAGYKYTVAEVLYSPFVDSEYDAFKNVSVAYQPTVQRFNVGASLKYDYRRLFDFYIKGVFNSYNLKHEETWKNAYMDHSIDKDTEIEAYGLPSLTLNLGINARPLTPLTISLDYCMLSGLYARVNMENVEMKSINDLRLRASWKFGDTFGVYAQFNNLLFQKQELYYGYPLQPFTAMAGININF
ncbi:MAG: TonB-dependent receptor [Tannerella sp.]|jgi:hypothetical protein|nr:TonB-dependent receptor [Tannerella sp.]